MRGLVLVGTDTGVGKTTVACSLLRLASRKGFRLLPFKPVETGCAPFPADALRLIDAAALPDLAPEQICPLQFAAPLAPSVAARLAGRPISPDTLLLAGSALAQRGDALLVETAGGLLTPYAPGTTSASLATLFAMDVLLVAANRLGTINHTALAVAELSHRHLPLAGIVLVDVSPLPAPDGPFNAHEIEVLTGIAPLGTLRHCPTLHPDALADAAATDLDLSRLLGGVFA